jgi:regulator of sigma E protease
MISDALSALSTAGNLALVIIGFGALIFVHELGHFLAARWAGVRAHEFSIGFGPALCSFRKGLGFKVGSTNAEYARRLKETHGVIRPEDDVPGLSATEYRLNLIPFGGYVKMLGQDDSDPSATSDAPDSYNKKPIWKRMIIISGGVFLNVVTGAPRRRPCPLH